MALTEPERQIFEHAQAWFEQHDDEFVEQLGSWVRVESVSRADGARDGAPFGPGVHEMFDVVRGYARAHGMRVQEHDGYALSVLLGEHEREIGLISHLDVVPAGHGWTYPPFELTVRDGYLIGRGVRDNKGAALLDLFLLRYLRDRGWPLASSVRVILGGAEETGMADMEYVVRTGDMPDVSLVTDGFFPVNNAQHGRVEALVQLPLTAAGGSWEAGDADNSVPALASVSFASLSADDERRLHDVIRRAQAPVTVERAGTGARIEAEGRSGHAAFPGATINATGVLASVVAEAALLDESDAVAVAMLARLLADPFGSAAGLGREDASGRLTLNGGRLVTARGQLQLTLTARVPIESAPRDVLRDVSSLVVPIGGSVEERGVVEAHVVPADDPVVELLRSTFDDTTGARTQPVAMGGGTHARIVPRAHTFGPGLWTEQAKPHAARLPADFLAPGHGDPHGPDECAAIDNLRLAFGIYAVAITRLDAMLR